MIARLLAVLFCLAVASCIEAEVIATDTMGMPTLIWEQRADQGPFDVRFEVRL